MSNKRFKFFLFFCQGELLSRIDRDKSFVSSVSTAAAEDSYSLLRLLTDHRWRALPVRLAGGGGRQSSLCTACGGPLLLPPPSAAAAAAAATAAVATATAFCNSSSKWAIAAFPCSHLYHKACLSECLRCRLCASFKRPPLKQSSNA